ncbi:ASCH domain-containing protein [Enterococcus cecorum]|nr:ASCH domain-containing protein [Enterococcus cecorum]
METEKDLLTIKPENVNEIMSGRKKFEYRKKVFNRKDITTIVVYATKPLGKVVVEFEVDEILEDTLDVLWQETKRYSGISEMFFTEYFMHIVSELAIK